MTISKKDAKLLLYVSGILIFVLVYFFGYNNLKEQREALEAENTKLIAEQTRINDIYMNQSTYEEQTRLRNKNTKDLIKKYPAGVQEEDAILYAVSLENGYDMLISNVSYAPRTLISNMESNMGTSSSDDGISLTTTDVDAALGIISASDVAAESIELYDTIATYNFTVGYTDCKRAFQSILDCTDLRNVPSIALSYDGESGKLMGVMNVNMYYMTGTEKTYSEPVAGVDIKHGVKDIFGTDEKN